MQMGLAVSVGLGLSPVASAEPATAELAFSDFKNGVYRLDGSASTLTAMYEEDTDFGNFQTNNVVAGVGLTSSGVVGGEDSPVAAAALAALLADGFSATIIFVVSDATTQLLNLQHTDFAVFDPYVDLMMRATGDGAPSYIDAAPGYDEFGNELAAGSNTIEVVMSADLVSYAVNGGATHQVVNGAALTGTLGIQPGGAQGSAVESITYYAL